MRFLPRWLRRAPPPPAPFTTPLDLPAPVAVIGDVHGCDALLGRLLDRIARDPAMDPALRPDARVVCVGDYLDRGESSAAVIDRLMARPDLVCLKGNHEAMALGFLDDPGRHAARWLRHGGLQTLASYGVAGPDPAAGRDPGRVRDDLARTMGDARIAWLRALPLSWRSGNLLVTHAGADPAAGPDDQRDRHLMWGAPDFMTRTRDDGIWVAFGHVIQDAPLAHAGRIAVDTGAYATGTLTAAILGDGPVRFVTARPD